MCEGWYEGAWFAPWMCRDIWRGFISGGTSNLAERGKIDVFKINDDDDDDCWFILFDWWFILIEDSNLLIVDSYFILFYFSVFVQVVLDEYIVEPPIMKVTVCFHDSEDTKLVVPCGDGQNNVKELIEEAFSRYKKKISKVCPLCCILVIF